MMSQHMQDKALESGVITDRLATDRLATDKLTADKLTTVLRVEALAAFVLATLMYAHADGSWGWYFALILVPDLSMLGYLINNRVGAICYNIVHSYVLPMLCFIAALILNISLLEWLSLIWLAHIGLDRTLGYGLKYASGFANTHLGIAIKKAQTN